MSETPKQREFLGLAITFYRNGKISSFRFTVGNSAILLALIVGGHFFGLKVADLARHVAALLK